MTCPFLDSTSRLSAVIPDAGVTQTAGAQEPEEDTSAEIYLTGAYFLLPFGSVLLLGLVALRVPGAQILAVGWYIFFLSFGPALFAVWCLYTCGAYDADALSVRDRLSTLSLRAYDARVAQLESEILEPVSYTHLTLPTKA